MIAGISSRVAVIRTPRLAPMAMTAATNTTVMSKVSTKSPWENSSKNGVMTMSRMRATKSFTVENRHRPGCECQALFVLRSLGFRVLLLIMEGAGAGGYGAASGFFSKICTRCNIGLHDGGTTRYNPSPRQHE